MHHGVERAKGIEPSYAAWEAAVLPLNYARDRPSLADLAPSAKRSVSRSRFTVNFQKFRMRSQAGAMIPSGLGGRTTASETLFDVRMPVAPPRAHP